MAPWGGSLFTALVIGTCAVFTMVALDDLTIIHSFSFSNIECTSSRDIGSQTFGAQCFCPDLHLGQKPWLFCTQTFGLQCCTPVQFFCLSAKEYNIFAKSSHDNAPQFCSRASWQILEYPFVSRLRTDCPSSIDVGSCSDTSRTLHSFQLQNRYHGYYFSNMQSLSCFNKSTWTLHTHANFLQHTRLGWTRPLRPLREGALPCKFYKAVLRKRYQFLQQNASKTSQAALMLPMLQMDSPRGTGKPAETGGDASFFILNALDKM